MSGENNGFRVANPTFRIRAPESAFRFVAAAHRSPLTLF